MASLNLAELVEFGNKQFESQRPLLNLWQSIGDNFMPERADFLRVNDWGDDFIDGLVDSYPILACRDLYSSYNAMLRDGVWFDIGVADEATELGKDARIWLEDASKLLLKAMNERSSGFERATGQGDKDFAAFGQCVISVELNKKRTGLLYRNWHLRDCAWWDDETGQVGGVVRKWPATARELKDTFGDKCHHEVSKIAMKDPFKIVNCYHIVMPSEMLGDEEFLQFKNVSIWIDKDNKHIIEKVGINHNHYVVPRFVTLANQPYAISPATIAALPNARVLQAMTFTMLEAGERHTRPPLIAAESRVRRDIDLTGDGITYVDIEAGERLEDSIRPLYNDKSGFNIGENMRGDIVGIISSCFYLNKLSLPETSREMTAYEVQERMKQYRRENLPLFTPMEKDYNGQLCEISFALSLNAGFFGSPHDAPPELRGQLVEFKFRSPLTRAAEEIKATQFAQVSQLVEQGMQHDETIGDNVDWDEMFRDSMSGLNTPERWQIGAEEVMNNRQAEAIQMMQMQQQQMEAASVEQ